LTWKSVIRNSIGEFDDFKHFILNFIWRITMYSVSNLNTQTLQPHSTSTVGSLMAGQAQPIVPMPNIAYNDPILEVFKQMEEGATQRYLEHSWKQPSASWLQDKIDKYILRAGKYTRSDSDLEIQATDSLSQDEVPLTPSENAMPTHLKAKRGSCLFDDMIVEGKEKLYKNDFTLFSTESLINRGLKRIVSTMKCALKIFELFSGEECSIDEQPTPRKTFCRQNLGGQKENICLAVAIGDEQGERPYCIQKNPRYVDVHIIHLDEISEKKAKLFNDCFAQYDNFCKKNCLSCTTPNDCSFTDKIGSNILIIYPERVRKGFNVTVISSREFTKFENVILNRLAENIIGGCSVLIDSELIVEKIYEFSGYGAFFAVAMWVSLAAFKIISFEPKEKVAKEEKEPKAATVVNE
jgi:hypothetical protein